MAATAHITLPSIVRGDTWDGLTITGVTIDGEAPSTELASVLIHFRTARTATGDAAHILSSADEEELVIDDAATWTVTAPAQSLPLTAGKWYFDVQFTDDAGAVRTYLDGTLTIIQDITR